MTKSISFPFLLFLAVALKLRGNPAVPGNNGRNEWEDERREFTEDDEHDSEYGDTPGVVAGSHHELELGARDLVCGDEGGYGPSFVNTVLDGAGCDEVVVDVFETGFVE